MEENDRAARAERYGYVPQTARAAGWNQVLVDALERLSQDALACEAVDYHDAVAYVLAGGTQLGHDGKLFFVDVGVGLGNNSMLYASRGWSGVLVEPRSVELVSKYPSREGIRHLRLAVGDSNTNYRPGGPDSPELPCIGLDALLDGHAVPTRVDVLRLDLEHRSVLSTVRQYSFKRRPRVLVIHRSSRVAAQRLELLAYLGEQGYALVSERLPMPATDIFIQDNDPNFRLIPR